MFNVPGDKISRFLNDWSTDEIYQDKDLWIYRSDLWKTVGQFQKELNEQESGQKMMYEKKLKMMD